MSTYTVHGKDSKKAWNDAKLCWNNTRNRVKKGLMVNPDLDLNNETNQNDQ